MALPFLRSPPFPGIAPHHAAISLAAESDRKGEAITDATLAAIAEHRVGGDFWGGMVVGLKIVARDGVAIAPAQLAGVAPNEIGILPSMLHRNMISSDDDGKAVPTTSDPWTLVANAQSVHAEAGDDIAIVAGLLAIPVYGPDMLLIAPDRLKAAARARIGMATYRDCFTGAAVPVAQAVAQLAQWRDVLTRNRGIAAAAGMAWWKRGSIRHFLWDGMRSPPCLSAKRAIATARQSGGAVAIWPSRVAEAAKQSALAQHVPLVQVEDGFLRSRGLGAALHPPSSVVVDGSGIYYDARSPSDLENLLATHDFSPALIARARALRERICATGAIKYGPTTGAALHLPKGRRTVLAIGQVEDDLSVRFGGAGITGNLDFLARVRAAEPDAHIVYRPHPDVVAGHRKGHIAKTDALALADQIDAGAPLMDVVVGVDEVHVLSSLTGFEALMRGRAVTTHGMPFFAGWGLTRDMAVPPARRQRLLTIDQIVAGTLILYPRYVDPVTRLPCGPELLVERMADGTMPPATWLTRMRAMQGAMRHYMTLAAEQLHG